MAVNKKYYWLRLKDDFFRDKAIKKLRKIAGGDTYTIIYLKLLLLGLQDNGKLYFDGIENNFESELALELDEGEEDVQVTIMFLKANGLLEEISKEEYFLTETAEMIGSETASAQRMRRVRQRQNINAITSQCDDQVPQCDMDVTSRDTTVQKRVIDIEIDIEKDIEKECVSNINSTNYIRQNSDTPTHTQNKKLKFAEQVFLTQPQYDDLLKRHGPEKTKGIIDTYSNRKQAKGYDSKSDYHTILDWGVRAYEERQATSGGNNSETASVYPAYGKFKTKAKGPYECSICRGYGLLEYEAETKTLNGKTATMAFYGSCPKCANWSVVKGDNDRAKEQQPVPAQYLATAKPFTEIL